MQTLPLGVCFGPTEPLTILFLMNSYKTQNYLRFPFHQTKDPIWTTLGKGAGANLPDVLDLWDVACMILILMLMAICTTWLDLGNVVHDGGDALLRPVEGAQSHAWRVGRAVPRHFSLCSLSEIIFTNLCCFELGDHWKDLKPCLRLEYCSLIAWCFDQVLSYFQTWQEPLTKRKRSLDPKMSACHISGLGRVPFHS